MALTRSALSLAGIILLSGAIVMMLFVILSGVADSTPLNKTYFLSADTSGITGARDRSQWTYFYVCAPGNVGCSGAWPAPAFGWAWSADPTDAPQALVGDHGGHTTSQYFYLMWRFTWVFYLLGLFFTVTTWLGSCVACCGRLGSAIAGLGSVVALFFFTLAVSMMTATFVKARDAFAAAGRDAHVGTWAFGFSWGAWAALVLATGLFFVGTRSNGPPAGAASAGGVKGGRTMFGRKRSVRSDLGGGRRVKEDYA